jgi:hypothetical protein
MLKENHSYKLLKSYDVQVKIMLVLRGYEDLQEFESLLLEPWLNEPFRRVKRLNKLLNGEEYAFTDSNVRHDSLNTSLPSHILLYTCFDSLLRCLLHGRAKRLNYALPNTNTLPTAREPSSS